MKLYRYDFPSYYQEYYGDLRLLTYYIFRETEKCYVIREPYSLKDKFVRKEAKAKFAYETKSEALVNYIKRTEKRIKRYLEPQLKRANIGLELAKRKVER